MDRLLYAPPPPGDGPPSCKKAGELAVRCTQCVGTVCDLGRSIIPENKPMEGKQSNVNSVFRDGMLFHSGVLICNAIVLSIAKSVCVIDGGFHCFVCNISSPKFRSCNRMLEFKGKPLIVFISVIDLKSYNQLHSCLQTAM